MPMRAIPTGPVICASPLAVTETRPASPPPWQRGSGQLLVMSGDLCGIAPQPEISITFPPDLTAMLHFERMHDRLLDHPTGTLPMQHFGRFRQTYIINRAGGEHRKFLHFENFDRRPNCANRERRH